MCVGSCPLKTLSGVSEERGGCWSDAVSNQTAREERGGGGRERERERERRASTGPQNPPFRAGFSSSSVNLVPFSRLPTFTGLLVVNVDVLKWFYLCVRSLKPVEYLECTILLYYYYHYRMSTQVVWRWRLQFVWNLFVHFRFAKGVTNTVRTKCLKRKGIGPQWIIAAKRVTHYWATKNIKSWAGKRWAGVSPPEKSSTDLPLFSIKCDMMVLH